MISLELARKLKNAGLEWEPKILDVYTEYGDGGELLTNYIKPEKDISVLNFIMKHEPDNYFCLYRLDQLLTEIERRGWRYKLASNDYGGHKYRVQLCVSNILNYNRWGDGFYANTPEDAAARALLWILEREHP